MAAEQTLNNREILDATQNAVIDAAGSVVQVVENVEHEISGHGGAFYENPEFWVARLLSCWWWRFWPSRWRGC